MTKQIKIEELIPFMRKGWVACNKNGVWCWYSAKPKIEIYFEVWYFCGVKREEISNVFNIAPVEDWQHSLIKIERK